MPFQLDMTRAAKASEIVMTSADMADLGRSLVRTGGASTPAHEIVESGHARTIKVLNQKSGAKAVVHQYGSATGIPNPPTQGTGAIAPWDSRRTETRNACTSGLSSSGVDAASVSRGNSSGIARLATGAASVTMDALQDEAASSDELDGFVKTGNAVRQTQGLSRRLGRARTAFQRGIRLEQLQQATTSAEAASAGLSAQAAKNTAVATGSSGAAGASIGGATGEGIASVAGGLLVPLLVILAAIFSLMLLVAAIDGGEDEVIPGLSENESLIVNLLREKGFDDLHIAAIMGNWSRESDCNPRQVQHGFGYCVDSNGNGVDDCTEQDDYPPELVNNASAGYGLAQWTYPSRARGLVDFARSRGAHSGDAEIQVSYFCSEFAGSVQRFSAIDDLEAATRWFHDVYEASADDESSIQLRVSAAERIYAAITHSGSSGYIAAAMAIADDDSHGYSMERRTKNPDVDCSSFVYYSLLDAGWTVSDLGSYPFTTFVMGPILERNGFERLPYTGMDDLMAGDILVNTTRHTEIYYGNGQSVGAHNDYDGRSGDSSGREVCLGGFWNFGITDVYRRVA